MNNADKHDLIDSEALRAEIEIHGGPGVRPLRRQLVVETDGLRYHRTPTQQARDRKRDQAHLRAGLTPLRFTHFQVRYESDDVQAILAAVAP